MIHHFCEHELASFASANLSVPVRGQDCYDRTVMSHTLWGGQASDQDSNSGPGRHGNNSGHI
jgi:hypothetical protein